MKLKFHKKHLPIYILTVFGFLLFFMGIMNHYFFRTVTYDYGNYNFAFWDYAHFRISPIPTFRGNFLQDHFSLTLMYFIPIYWLLNWLTGTYTLIIIQSSLILIAAWYSYRIIKLKSDNIWLGAGILAYYFLLLGRYTSFSADVNLAIISACFIPIFIYYFKIKKYIISFIILILSLFSRENIPLWFIFIFVVLIIDHRKDKKAVLFSLLGISVSFIYFFLLFKIFIPSLETENLNYALFNYSALGATPGEALLYVLKHPVESIKLFFINHTNDPSYDGVKAEFYWVYLISGGIFLFIRPQYLIWFIPIVAQKVLNDSYIRWGIATYYSIEIVTLLPLSVFLTLSTIKNKLLQNTFILITCIATTTMTIRKLDSSNNQVPWTLNISKVKIYSKHFFEAPFNIKKVNKLLDQIPPKAKISASTVLLPHIAQRQSIYYFPTVKDAEYIVFSVFDNNYLFSHNSNEEARSQYFFHPNWEIIDSEFPVFLFKYNESSNFARLKFNKLWTQTDTLFCDYENVDTFTGHVYFSNGEIADDVKNLSNDKCRSSSTSIILSPENPYSLSIKINDISQNSYFEISVWCHCTENNGNIVASGTENFYRVSNEGDNAEPTGWKKIKLSFWAPQNLDKNGLIIYLWNTGSQPAYFDDLQIIKYYKNTD